MQKRTIYLHKRAYENNTQKKKHLHQKVFPINKTKQSQLTRTQPATHNTQTNGEWEFLPLMLCSNNISQASDRDNASHTGYDIQTKQHVLAIEHSLQ